MMRVFKPGMLLVLISLVVTGCARSPVDAITDAENALRLARDVGARDCAPLEFKSAEEMMARTYRLNDEGEYKDAKRSALTTKELAQVAKVETERGDCKPLARDQVDDIDLQPGEGRDGARLGRSGLTASEVDAEIESTRLGEGSLGEGTRIHALKTVHFAFDHSGLDETALETIAENAEWLKDRPTVKVQVEGHTDERGSAEYNIALGERRAKAVRDALVRMGVESDRITTISYGEEAPADLGSGEEAWKENRRSEFVIIR